MKKINEWHENLTPSKKIIIYILSTIILGCIGSGVWAKILEPLLDVVFHFSIILIGKFSSSYIDNLYGAAARGLYDRSSLLVLFAVAIFSYFGFFTISDFRRQKNDKRKSNLWLIQMFLLCIAIMLMYQYIKIGAIKIIATSTLNSIEIVRPYVDDKNYYKLKSEFYQMRSLTDYENLYSKLKNISENFEDIKIGPKQTF